MILKMTKNDAKRDPEIGVKSTQSWNRGILAFYEGCKIDTQKYKK